MFLAAVMALSLVACGSKSDNGGSGDASGTETIKLGGMGSVPGSVISAIVLTVLPEALREVADYRMLVYAIVLILVMQATNNPTMKRFFASAKEKLTPGRKERAAL